LSGGGGQGPVASGDVHGSTPGPGLRVAGGGGAVGEGVCMVGEVGCVGRRAWAPRLGWACARTGGGRVAG
jgi:hypothetical protein